jgi:hypothetical protein
MTETCVRQEGVAGYFIAKACCAKEGASAECRVSRHGILHWIGTGPVAALVGLGWHGSSSESVQPRRGLGVA